MKKKATVILIIFLAFFSRLYRVNNPVADWHAFRQADTASVTREYVKNGIDLLRPRYQDLSNIQSGFDNPMGYRMVEFPFINAAIAALIRAFPKLDIVLTSRLVSILFSLGTLVALYFFVKKISSKKLAKLSIFFFAVLPYSVYYSRAVLPEAPMLFFSTFSLLSFLYFLKNKKTAWYLASVLSLALALLLKPFVAFLAPVYLIMSIIFLKKEVIKTWQLLLYPVIAFTPLLFWRRWIVNFPTGIPASDWLLNGNGIRLKPAWFRWLFYERIIKLFSGFVGAILLLLNFVKSKIENDLLIYAAWWFSILLYFIVVASGNVQHDYYQVILTPILCISLARGTLILLKLLKKVASDSIAMTLTILAVALTLYFSFQQIKGFFNVNHWEYVKAGKAVDELTPPSAKVIAPAMGDTMFLFQTNRVGWPIGFEIEDKIAKGATHYVTTSMDDEAKELELKYEVIIKNDDYLILDLTKPL